MNRFLPLPVSFRTSADRILCCPFHCGQSLKRCLALAGLVLAPDIIHTWHWGGRSSIAGIWRAKAWPVFSR